MSRKKRSDSWNGFLKESVLLKKLKKCKPLVDPRCLKKYQRQGLIASPVKVGRVVYHPSKTFQRLALIETMEAVGFSVSQMRVFLLGCSTDELIKVYQERGINGFLQYLTRVNAYFLETEGVCESVFRGIKSEAQFQAKSELVNQRIKKMHLSLNKQMIKLQGQRQALSCLQSQFACPDDPEGRTMRDLWLSRKRGKKVNFMDALNNQEIREIVKRKVKDGYLTNDVLATFKSHPKLKAEAEILESAIKAGHGSLVTDNIMRELFPLVDKADLKKVKA